MTTGNIVYKTLGFWRLNQAFCPASAFVSVDRNEARNPQRFIPANVVGNSMSTQPSDSNPTKNEHTNSKKRKFEQ